MRGPIRSRRRRAPITCCARDRPLCGSRTQTAPP